MLMPLDEQAMELFNTILADLRRRGVRIDWRELNRAAELARQDQQDRQDRDNEHNT